MSTPRRVAIAALTAAVAACAPAGEPSAAPPAGSAAPATSAPPTTSAPATTSPTPSPPSPTASASPEGPDADALPRLGHAPALTGLDGWLQADGIGSLADLRGQVVVVQFWTFGCINCKHTLPNLRALYDRHRGEEFEVVGVHAPEFEYEKDPDAIAAAAADLGVTWPIALDTDKTSFGAWQGRTRYWPRTYVLDQTGQIRFDRIGEGAYEELNETVATLLADPPA